MFVFRVFSIVLLVLLMSQCVFAVPMYEKVGGSVVLDSGHKSGPLTSVTWKHQADLALEWFGSEITCYRTFQGRCNLDKTTGSFTITNLILEDGGKYTPEINSVVGDTMELKVIKPVPKPTVSMDCNTEKTVCNLTCNADISSEFGPITYKWKTGDTELSNKEELSLPMKNEEASFFCVLGNPVSNSTSDEFSNPMSKESNIVTVVAVLVGIFILLIAVGVVALVMYKRDPRVRTLWPFKYFSKNQDNVSRGKDEVGVEEGQRLLTVPQPAVENKSKGKEALNGYQPVNVNEDEINNTNHTVVSIEQQQQDPPTEQVSDNKAEPGQISTSEETKPTAEEPGINNINHTVVAIEQQQLLDPPTEQVSDNEEEPGQSSTSEETKPTAEEPGKSKDSTCDPPADTEPEQESSQESNLVPSAESPEASSQTEIVSPPKPRRAVTPGTDSAES